MESLKAGSRLRSELASVKEVFLASNHDFVLWLSVEGEIDRQQYGSLLTVLAWKAFDLLLVLFDREP